MAMSRDKKPLLRGPGGHILSSSEWGDQYFLEDGATGAARKLSTAEAASIWRGAPGNGWVPVGEPPPKEPGRKRRASSRDKPREAWQAELRQRLGLDEDDQ